MHLSARALPDAQGWVYLKALDGRVEVSEAAGFCRSCHEPVNPAVPWTPDTRVHLASVSKPVTAIAVFTLLQAGRLSLDDPFTRYVRFGDSSSLLGEVSIRDLLRMRSGLRPDAALDGTGGLDAYVRAYLREPPQAPSPGPYRYSNANFAILQAVIEQASGTGYTEYVSQSVLLPSGIAPERFSPFPEPPTRATLAYAGACDITPGEHWGTIGFCAAGGWVATAHELAKLLRALRTHAILSPPLTRLMLGQQLGWYGKRTPGGISFYHDGVLTSDRGQGISTAIQISPREDGILLVNSPAHAARVLARLMAGINQGEPWRAQARHGGS
jgi:CubicO group peptidase (beta-lactamase class C family)